MTEHTSHATGQTGRFVLADNSDVVLRPSDVAEMITARGWTLDRAGEYLGVSGSHVGAFLRRNGYRPAARWVGNDPVTRASETTNDEQDGPAE